MSGDIRQVYRIVDGRLGSATLNTRYRTGSVELPFLDVRVDGTSGLGQTRTRVGAFVESLAARKRREDGP